NDLDGQHLIRDNRYSIISCANADTWLGTDSHSSVGSFRNHHPSATCPASIPADTPLLPKHMVGIVNHGPQDSSHPAEGNAAELLRTSIFTGSARDMGCRARVGFRATSIWPWLAA